MNKTIEEIKELLESAEVREILQTEIQEAVKSTEAEYQEKIAKLEEDKKSFEKETFITKKMLVAKANLYEQKLKSFYQSKFTEAKEKLATEVFSFIQESTDTLVKSVKEDVVASSKIAKLQESFSQAVRLMAPHMNINELVDDKSSELAAIKDRLNKALAENKELKSERLSEDIQALIVKETIGYLPEATLAITSALKKMNIKSLSEAAEVITNLKKAIRNHRKAETDAAGSVVESKEVKLVTKKNTDIKKLDQVIKETKERKAAVIEENKQAVAKSFTELRLPDYEIV